ncbi:MULTISPECIES: hypothetical protein [unclassified Pseudoalteromonas]|uniref:hypothetical protein n=1 Tax=unclassified Pseudoalteromonas TaxID=194690 RepID=UPI0025B58BFF|nr:MULTISPECIES: hypothetical protein [unclassified Pseudoalteromonas]MDN3396378.1 hypothetical protein [Pseudoalteromonas sp. APC 3215]MDN3403001.1 hypothetical protein [Pseudoalteromonas sp. APC 3213]MDN3472653.1 hypothetical protein [Pseudoalteromonas sp. APC 4026]
MKILPFACMALVTSISSAYSEQTQAHAIWFAERSSQVAFIYGEGAQDLDTVKRQNKIKSITGYNKNWQLKKRKTY